MRPIAISRPRRRGPGHVVLAIVVAFAALPFGGTIAGAAPADQAAAKEAAARWIAAELGSDAPDFDVFGATSARNDVVYALASADSELGAGRRALEELSDGAGEYVGDPGAVNPGALAKTLLSFLIHGQDPALFVDGRNLESELRAAMSPDGTFGDDVFNHSLAVIALGATDAGVPTAALTALEDYQCDAGDFTFLGTCPGDPDGPDVDVTALAIQALLAAGSDQRAAAGAAWLAGVQNADGSWPNPFGPPNTNSAGVAGQALRAAGETAAADLAADFVMSLQNDDGGIRFAADDEDSNGFATLQGILAMGGPGYWQLSARAFDDVDADALFAREISWLAYTGISRGCDPPVNDAFCPERSVTRGEMAAFLSRALQLTDTGDATFVDTDDTVFTDDIARIATAGITRGCNPPTNDAFCPDRSVTRGEMAAFLYRALVP